MSSSLFLFDNSLKLLFKGSAAEQNNDSRDKNGRSDHDQEEEHELLKGVES